MLVRLVGNWPDGAVDVVVDTAGLVIVELPELVVVAGGSTTVIVCAALVTGIPVLSVAVTVRVAVG